MQHFVNLCESLHTFGQHAVYGSLVTMFTGLAAPEDGVAAVGQYKYPRRRPRLEVMLHVIHFSEDRVAQLSRRGTASRRGEPVTAHVA